MSKEHTRSRKPPVIREIGMIFKTPIGSDAFSTASAAMDNPQNSKSKESWIWRAPVPATGCLNPGIDVEPEPKTGLICDTFGRLKRLKNSATRSRRFAPPNGKYLRTRKSIVKSAGVLREFLPRASGLAESGKAWL